MADHIQPISVRHRRTGRGRRRAQHAVFLDRSGWRRVMMRRVGWVLVAPTLAYLAVLMSTVVGGPSVDSPLLPEPPGERDAPRWPIVTNEVGQPTPSSSRKTKAIVGPPATDLATAPTLLSVQVTPATSRVPAPETAAQAHSPAARSQSRSAVPGNKPTAPPGQEREPARPPA